MTSRAHCLIRAYFFRNAGATTLRPPARRYLTVDGTGYS